MSKTFSYEEAIAAPSRGAGRTYSYEEATQKPTLGSSFMKGLESGVIRTYATDAETRPPETTYSGERLERPAWATPESAPPEPPPEPGAQYPEPETVMQKVAYDVGNYSPLLAASAAAAPAMPLISGAGPLTAAGLESMLALAGMTAARGIEEAGGGPILQTAGDLAVAAAAPAMIVKKGPQIVGRLARNAPDGAEEGAQAVIRYLESRGIDVGGGRPADPTDAYEAAIAVKRQFPRGVEEGDRFIDGPGGAVEKVEKAQEVFTDPLRQPSLSQATEELGGYNVARRELQYSNADPDYAAANYGRRLETLEYVQNAADEQMPRFSGYTTTKDTAQTILDEADSEAARLWRAVPLESMPKVPTGRLKSAVIELADESKVGRKYLPREANTILSQYGDEISYAELQALSSELSTTVRLGERAGPMNEMAYRRAGRAKKLLKVVEQMIDEVGDPGDVAALREARAATRRSKELNTPVMRKILASGDPVEVLNELRRSDDIFAETRRLVDAFGERGEALGGIREAARLEIFGDNLGDRTVKQMRNSLNSRKNRQLHNALFAPEQREVFDRIITMQAKAGSGIASTAGQARGTATGYRNTDDLLEIVAEINAGNRSYTGKMVEAIRNGFRRLGDATSQSIAIEKLASMDLELARLLLTTPTPKNLPALQSAWNNAISRLERQSPNLFRASEAGVRAATREDLQMLQNHFESQRNG